MSDSFSFNLVAEPWLPCLMNSGRRQELSLRQVLAQSPDIREVVDASPLVTAALHRLLLAILHRCFGPASDSEWAELWNRGSFDTGVVNAYLDKWKSHFDLFDAERPFYQTTGLAPSAATTVARFTHELSSGHNKVLFDHSIDSVPAPLSPGTAGRYLVALHAFALTGLVSFQKDEGKQHRSAFHAPLVKGAVTLLIGRSLLETLLFNMVNLDGRASAPFEFDPLSDVPAWEQEEPVKPSDRLPKGYLDLLTYQSRRILLLPEMRNHSVVVPRIVLMKGYQFPASADMHTRETMVAFQMREKAAPGQDPWPPVGFRPERALWRDSLALLEKMPGRRRIPRTFEELAARPLGSDHTVEVAALGMSSDRSQVLLWRHERLPLPLQYLRDPDLVAVLREAIDAGERAAGALRSAVWFLAEKALFPEGQPDRGRLRSMVDSLAAPRPYWAALDPLFRKLMVDLADGWPPPGEEGPLRAWGYAVGGAAADAFDAAARSLETSGRGLRAGAEAREVFHALLYRTLDSFLPSRKEVTT